MLRTALVAVLVISALTHAVAADEFYREDLRIPMAAAGPRGLEAMLIRPTGTRRYPLALLSHGAPRDAASRPGMTPDVSVSLRTAPLSASARGSRTR